MSDGSSGDDVVLLHGLMRTSASMAALEKALVSNGYRVLNIDYPSRKHSIADLADILRPAILNFAKDKNKKQNFVGHSMGGLVIRAYIARHRPENLGRVVMLGTPNHGSEVADFLRNNFLYKALYGPAGQQLTTDYRPAFGKADYEAGVVAGNVSFDPLSSFLIKGTDDGKLSVASTHLEGEKDHIVLPAGHMFMPGNKKVIAETIHFLAHGKFSQNF